MQATGSNGNEPLIGMVEAVNERGVKPGGTWRNLSKRAEDVECYTRPAIRKMKKTMMSATMRPTIP